MTEQRRVDPVGQFVSACLGVLVGVGALALALHLLESIWLPLALLAGGSLLIAVLVLAAIRWHRRQPW